MNEMWAKEATKLQLIAEITKKNVDLLIPRYIKIMKKDIVFKILYNLNGIINRKASTTFYENVEHCICLHVLSIL